MGVAVKKTYPALKHGGYASTVVLPGESAAEFRKLYQRLIAEYSPNGASEDHIVASMAWLIWRKEHLGTFRIADRARERFEEIFEARDPAPVTYYLGVTEVELAVRDEALRAAEVQTRTEFGAAYELAHMDETTTMDGLMKDLEVQDKMDSMIDRHLKRLLLVRGVKSI
jgi:hypothetical protein